MGDDRRRSEGDNVSIAYAGGGRQPILANVAASIGAFFDNVVGSDEASPSDETDSQNSKDREVPFYCLPVLSCGKGERGRWNVRVASALFFPLFLLSFFLLDDVGHILMRNIKLRNAMKGGGEGLKASKVSTTRPALLRKTVKEYPGIKRELLWVPLDQMLDVYYGKHVKATMKCPRGILFLFHGCQRYAASFFYSPQGRKLVSMAYHRGVEVVSFEKTTELGCWSWSEDGEAVLKIGKKFLSSRLLGACGVDGGGNEIFPPIWAFGASSGGSFIAKLASEMELEPEKHKPFLFSALNVQIMSPRTPDWNTPSIFTVMEGDPHTKLMVAKRVEEKTQGGPFKMIATSGEKAIHANHFAETYPDDDQMSPAVSNEIYKDLVQMNVIDPSNGDKLTANPRQMADTVESIWEKYDASVRKAASPDSKDDVLPFGVSHELMQPLRAEEVQDANSIWLIEELNVAWDQHEITAERFEEVLSFFFQHGNK